MSDLKKPIVIKIGGSFFNSINDPNNPLLMALSELYKAKQPVVLLHGGGEQVLERLSALGFKSEKIHGLRVTPSEHMPIVTSVLAGELNKFLVAKAGQFGINAVGISLADGNIASCVKHDANIGMVGEPKAQSSQLLEVLLGANMQPFIASIGKDNQGNLYNVNGDHAAICIASLLNTGLYFLSDVQGVLDDNQQILTELDAEKITQLVQSGVISDGMAVKVVAANETAKSLNQTVSIASWQDAYKLLVDELPCGTSILPH